MEKLKENPTTYACRLWPRDAERLTHLADYLEIVGDGSAKSFADCVKWMLQLPAVEKIVQNRRDAIKHGVA